MAVGVQPSAESLQPRPAVAQSHHKEPGAYFQGSRICLAERVWGRGGWGSVYLEGTECAQTEGYARAFVRGSPGHPGWLSREGHGI